jgi:hypothetical protein
MLDSFSHQSSSERHPMNSAFLKIGNNNKVSNDDDDLGWLLK